LLMQKLARYRIIESGFSGRHSIRQSNAIRPMPSARPATTRSGESPHSSEHRS
jgi:hypothetical protein